MMPLQKCRIWKWSLQVLKALLYICMQLLSFGYHVLCILYLEVLRYFGTTPRAERVCSQDYSVPGTDFVIAKNSVVLIPVYGFHHDDEYFPDPEKFIPERFTQEAKSARHPYAYMPFGHGPRNCIVLWIVHLSSITHNLHLLIVCMLWITGNAICPCRDKGGSSEVNPVFPVFPMLENKSWSGVWQKRCSETSGRIVAEYCLPRIGKAILNEQIYRTALECTNSQVVIIW